MGHFSAFIWWLLLVASFVIVKTQAPSSAAECQVSQWSAWGKCQRDPPCESHESKTHEKQPASYKEHPNNHSDAGRSGMRENSRIKMHTWNETAHCQANGSCPQFDPHGSDGPKACIEGLAGIYPCRNVDRLSIISVHDLGYRKMVGGDRYPMANDIWGWTDPVTGDEYALVGTSGGTSFVRITKPEKPEVVGFLYASPGTKSSLWRDIKVVNGYAFIVSEAYGHGMQVFRLSRLRYQRSLRVFHPDWWYRGFGKAHNIVANEETGYVYAVGDNESKFKWPASCKGGLHIINVKNPRRPVFEGCFDEDGYTHDAQCVVYRGPDKRYTGHELCFNCNEDTLTIADVTNHTKPVLVSKRGYVGSKYTHQGWLTKDQSVFIMGDERDELGGRNPEYWRTKTYIWDVSDLKNPQLKHIHRSIQRSVDHNQYIKGDFTFQSNYDSGLRILHIDQKHFRLREVGYFDVFSSGPNLPRFRGSWSNYPYFKSGIVAVTSMSDGLFLVRPNYSKMYKAAHQKGPQGGQFRTRTIIRATRGKSCPALEQRRECTPNDICPQTDK